MGRGSGTIPVIATTLAVPYAPLNVFQICPLEEEIVASPEGLLACITSSAKPSLTIKGRVKNETGGEVKGVIAHLPTDMQVLSFRTVLVPMCTNEGVIMVLIEFQNGQIQINSTSKWENGEELTIEGTWPL